MHANIIHENALGSLSLTVGTRAILSKLITLRLCRARGRVPAMITVIARCSNKFE